MVSLCPLLKISKYSSSLCKELRSVLKPEMIRRDWSLKDKSRQQGIAVDHEQQHPTDLICHGRDVRIGGL